MFTVKMQAPRSCRAARLPKFRIDFWESKLSGNVARDGRQRVELEALGWTVMVVWECETHHPNMLTELANHIPTKEPALMRPDIGLDASSG